MTDFADASADPLQERVFSSYLALAHEHSSWAGKLILLPGMGESETALAFAGIIAGALVLTIDADTDRQRNSLRSGAAHFVVNTVDEALRVLKNEARRGAALCVGLEADPLVEIPALERRGLLPALVLHSGQSASAEKLSAAIASFGHMGSILWSRGDAAKPATARNLPGLELRRFSFTNAPARQRFDTAALSILPAEDHLRHRWLEAAHRVLPRSRPVIRILPLSPEEVARLDTSL